MREMSVIQNEFDHSYYNYEKLKDDGNQFSRILCSNYYCIECSLKIHQRNLDSFDGEYAQLEENKSASCIAEKTKYQKNGRPTASLFDLSDPNNMLFSPKHSSGK